MTGVDGFGGYKLLTNEKNPLRLGGDVLNLSMDSTSQYLNDSAKCFDNHVVAFSVACTKQEETKQNSPPSIDRFSNLLTLFVRSYITFSSHTLSVLYFVYVHLYVSPYVLLPALHLHVM